jgi:hypothetical protein
MQRAMVRAQLILATWTLFKPPRNETFVSLWPVATEWLPQPQLHIEQRSVGLRPAGGENGSTVIYDDDGLAFYRPPGGALRLAPGGPRSNCQSSGGRAC